MPKIQYTASEFPPAMGSNFKGQHSFNISWFDIIWAAVSVGKMDLNDLLGHNHFSLDEFRYRMFMIMANLWEKNDYIYRSPAYDSLDPTEKGAISYFLGMAFAKLIGLYLFNVPWLIHLQKLDPTTVETLPGRSRPDMVGFDINGNLLVMEAKGRTGGFDQSAIDNAKKQAAQIRSINSQLPFCKVASEVFFSDWLNICLIDPVGDEDDSYDILTDRSLLHLYYQPLIPIQQDPHRRLQIRNTEYSFIDYPELGASIGIVTNIDNILKRGPLRGDIFQRQIISDISEKGYGLATYPDGISIALDKRWSKSVMEKIPSQR